MGGGLSSGKANRDAVNKIYRRLNNDGEGGISFGDLKRVCREVNMGWTDDEI